VRSSPRASPDGVDHVQRPSLVSGSIQGRSHVVRPPARASLAGGDHVQKGNLLQAAASSDVAMPCALRLLRHSRRPDQEGTSSPA
jgi:hypothetical protein